MEASVVLSDETEDKSSNCPADGDNDTKESEHFMRIINAFKSYRSFSLRRVIDAEKHFNNLPDRQKYMILPNFEKHLQNVKDCIDGNDSIIKLIIQDAEHLFENKQMADKEEDTAETLLPMVSDMEKVKTTIKQFVRDWSSAGKHEREACYDPVIALVMERFPPDKCEASEVNILVPGAGLGRLAFEFAKQGYSCQGNEWSLFMLLSSNFVLNKCKDVDAFTLYPWVHQWTNNMRYENQTQPISFPDTDTAELPENADFSMAAGDFLEVYNELNSWDCVVTVYFIDTAHNIISYIEKIYTILKPGGYWVNLGPLLYHYADMPNEVSIELPYEDVIRVMNRKRSM